MPLFKDKVLVEGSIAFTAMRGKTDMTYQNLNSFYQTDINGVETLLGAPYDEFDDYFQQSGGGPCDPFDADPSDDVGCIPLAHFIEQGIRANGLQASGRSQSSQVLETELGFRWRALRWLDVVGGFRQSRYDDVATELRPVSTATTVAGDGSTTVNVQTMEEVERSVTYEGFYAGVRIRLY
jgi:hypothetical protein